MDRYKEICHPTFLTVIFIVFACSSVRAMTCPPCERIHCSPKSASKLNCKGGVTTGVCGCCPQCARIEDEKCGGYYNSLGKCDKGLYCEVLTKTKRRRGQKGRELEGICKKVPAQVKDQPPEQRRSCRPKCTPEYCTKHPRAICSAVAIAEVVHSCQTKCQHTSCSACRFIEQPSCRKCKEDDFRCLRKFGRCIRKDTCSRKKFPCKKKYTSHWLKQSGKFQCFTPRC